MDLSSLLDHNTAKFAINAASCQMGIPVSYNSRFFRLFNAPCIVSSDLLDNCVGINNRRYYLMLWNTLTLLFVLSVYPLVLLDPKASDAVWLKLLVAFQFVLALMGSILGFFYSCFLWYVALKGIYQVDTFDAMMLKESPKRKMERAEKFRLREQLLILFGSADLLEIADIWGYGSRILPLNGLEWTFLQCEGGITTSDEDDFEDGDESRSLLSL